MVLLHSISNIEFLRLKANYLSKFTKLSNTLSDLKWKNTTSTGWEIVAAVVAVDIKIDIAYPSIGLAIDWTGKLYLDMAKNVVKIYYGFQK